MDKKAFKKAALLFIAEFVVWLLAGIIIGAIFKGDWRALLTNGNFLILAGVLSLLSAFFDFQKGNTIK